jgi:putative molybdopterin biosynthesis protein
MSTPRLGRSTAPESAQTQFLDVVTRDEATARFRQHLRLAPLGTETLPLNQALNRVLAEDVASDVDVPGFDRSNVDGFALQAADTFGAMEETPRQVTLNDEVLAPGVGHRGPCVAGVATPIATAECCRAAPTRC